MNYPKPKLFKPSAEEELEVAKKLAALFSPKVGVTLTDGAIIQGYRQSKTDRHGNTDN